jgi:Fucose permease
MYSKNLLLVAACAAIVMFGITCVAIGTINEYLTKSFEVDKIFIGLLASLFATGALIGSVSFGPIVDRFGYKVILIVSLLLLFAGFETIGRTSDLNMVRAVVFMFGLGGGVINGGTSALVSDLNPDKKGAYLSILGVFWGVGALSFPLITSVLLKSGVDYSTILSTIGLFVLIPILMFSLLKCPPAKNSEGIPFKRYVEMIKNPAIQLIAFFLFFQSGFETLVTTWTPKYFLETYALDMQTAILSLTVMSVSLTLARVLLGYVLKKVENWKVVMGGLFVIVAGFLIMRLGGSFSVGLIGVAIIGAGASATVPVMLGYVGAMYPEISGAAFSLVLFIALTGNAILNAVGGVVFEAYQIGSFIVFMIGISVVMFVILSFIVRKLKRD